MVKVPRHGVTNVSNLVYSQDDPVYKIGYIRDTMSAQLVRVSNCEKAAANAAFLPLYRTVAGNAPSRTSWVGDKSERSTHARTHMFGTSMFTL